MCKAEGRVVQAACAPHAGRPLGHEEADDQALRQ
jgi:hypothetical protein